MESTVKYPGFRWFVGITYVAVIVSSALALISIAPLMGNVAKTIGHDVGATAGIVMSTFNLFVALGAIAGGAIVDKLGIVKTWFGCLVLLIIGALLTPALGNTGTGMTIIRAIQGAGTGPIMGCAAAVAAQWFPAKERGILTGMQGLSMGAGVAIGTILGPSLANLTGNWQTGLALEAVITIVALIMAIVVYFGPKPPVVEEISSNKTDVLPTNAQEFKNAMLRVTTLGALICCFTLSWIFQAMGDLTPSYLAIAAPVGLGKGPLLAGQIYSCFSFAFMIGAMCGGLTTQKIFKGKTKYTVALGFFVTAVTVYGLKLSGIVSAQSLLIIVLIISGFFMAQVQPPIYAFIATEYPEQVVGKVGGTIVGLSIFGGVAGATAGAYALHATGRYMMGMNIIVIVALIGIIGTFLLNKPKVYTASKSNKIDVDV